jgi:hypothetical protein
MTLRRTIGRAALAVAAAAAALALWASLASAALGGSSSTPDNGGPRYVLTQTGPSDGSGTGGHHCHFGGGGPNDTTPSTSAQNTSV